MRTIKFRGKRVDNGEWVTGYVLFSKDNSEAVIAKLTDTESVCENVDPATVGQFTGLLDKNGKEIYEGDIYRFDHPDSINEVSYSIGGGFAGFDFSPAFTDGNKLTDIEVIGNIHDNPELLNQEVYDYATFDVSRGRSDPMLRLPDLPPISHPESGCG